MKISVIMPVYNAEKYLRECMDSILGQTLGDFEMFCINDGSTDGSEAILAEYAAKDSRVKLLATPHVGAYKARREGLMHASGEFIYFMDSDDALETCAFKELTELADKENLDEIVFTAEVFSDDDDAAAMEQYRKRFITAYALKDSVCGKAMSGPDLFRKSVLANCYFPGPPMRITRKHVIDAKNCGFPEAPFHGDNYFTTVSLYNSNRAMALNRKYYRRRVRTDSITTSVGTEKIHYASTVNVVKALLEFPPMQQDVLEGNKAALRYLTRLARNLARRSRTLDAKVMRELFDKTSDGCGAAVFILLNAVCRPALLALDERPCSVHGCLKYAFGRLLGLRPRLRDYLAQE